MDRRFLFLGLPAALLVATPALGEVLPGFDMAVLINGIEDLSFDEGDGSTTGDPSIFEYSGSYSSPGLYAINGYMCTTDVDQRRMTMTYGFVNNSALTQTFTVYALAPVQALAGASSVALTWGMSVQDQNGNGATLAAVAGSAMYSGRIDGAIEEEAYFFPTALTAPANGGNNVTSGSPSFSAGAAIIDDIALRITFTLTPGDTASFNSTFLVIPGPGALALLGLAGLVGSRRRSRV